MKELSDESEAALFARHDDGGAPSAIFVLGAPRTGSTAFYQAMIAAFDLPYLSNLADQTNSAQAILGVLGSWRARGESSQDRFRSLYGKTDGPHGASEGSAVMRRWCGGGHPTEIVSPGVLPDRVEHMRATLRAIEKATGKPLLIKNAWNCFRVGALARIFPEAAFVWIRRDIAAAAASDLAARYAVQGDPNAWNSATPRNIEALRARPYWEQVAENQFEFARATSAAAAGLSADRFEGIWYEDFCKNPSGAMEAIASRLKPLRGIIPSILPQDAFKPSGATLSVEDRQRLRDYLNSNPEHWRALRYREGD